MHGAIINKKENVPQNNLYRQIILLGYWYLDEKVFFCITYLLNFIPQFITMQVNSNSSNFSQLWKLLKPTGEDELKTQIQHFKEGLSLGPTLILAPFF